MQFFSERRVITRRHSFLEGKPGWRWWWWCIVLYNAEMVLQDINRWHNWQYLNLLRLVVCFSLNAAHVPSGTIRRLVETSIVVVARHAVPYIINNKLLKNSWQSMSFHFIITISTIKTLICMSFITYNILIISFCSCFRYTFIFYFFITYDDFFSGFALEVVYMVGNMSFLFLLHIIINVYILLYSGHSIIFKMLMIKSDNTA